MSTDGVRMGRINNGRTRRVALMLVGDGRRFFLFMFSSALLRPLSVLLLGFGEEVVDGTSDGGEGEGVEARGLNDIRKNLLGVGKVPGDVVYFVFEVGLSLSRGHEGVEEGKVNFRNEALDRAVISRDLAAHLRFDRDESRDEAGDVAN